MPIILIIVGILLLVYLLLLCPLVITADLSGEPELFLKFLFLKFRVYPMKKKEKKKKEQDAKPKDKKKSKTKPHGISYYIDKYGELIKSLLNSAGKLLKHIRLSRLDVSITVAHEDAANTAVEYGAACAVVYPIVSILESNVEVKESSISIKPDFDAKTSSGTLYADIRIRVFHVFAALFRLASQLIKFLK